MHSQIHVMLARLSKKPSWACSKARLRASQSKRIGDSSSRCGNQGHITTENDFPTV